MERPVGGELLITQFATRGAVSAYDEFVEIYNASRKNLTVDGVLVEYQAASCSGWQVRHALAAGTVLAPGQFYLTANMRGYAPLASGPVVDGELSQSGFSDSALLRLSGSTGSLLDGAAFGSGLACLMEGVATPAQGNSAGSLSRNPGAFSPFSPVQDTGNNSLDFGQSSVRNPRNSQSALQPSAN